jgi:hypothetical protein
MTIDVENSAGREGLIQAPLAPWQMQRVVDHTYALRLR